MAELKTVDQEPAESSCCSSAAQETCCEPESKGACCGPEHEAGNCGCSAGPESVPAEQDELRDTVRERYAKVGKRVTGAGARTGSRKATEEGTVHRALPPHHG